MKKQYLFILFALVISVSIYGQKELFSLSINGGYSYTLLKNEIPESISKEKTGYLANLQFNLALTRSFGIGTGVGFTNYSSAISLDKYYSATPATDSEGDNYEYRIYGSDIIENQSVEVIEIPFLLTFKNQEHKKFKTYLELGAKALLPLRSRFECTAGDIESRGFYSEYNVELSNMPNHGFDQISITGVSGNLLTQIGYAATIEFGANIAVGKPYITIALFGSYGITNICQNRSLLSSELVYQSISSVANSVKPYSVGVKVGLLFPFYSKK